MAKPTVENIRGLGDFQTLFRWDLSFVKFPNIGTYPGSESLNFRCQSTTMPKTTNQKIKNSIRGNYTYQPGIQEYDGQITLTFIETVDNTVKNMIRAWREAVWNTNTGASGSKADVEGTLLLTLLNNQDQPIWPITLIGAFLEDHDLGQLESEASDSMKPTLIFSYDYYKD